MCAMEMRLESSNKNPSVIMYTWVLKLLIAAGIRILIWWCTIFKYAILRNIFNHAQDTCTNVTLSVGRSVYILFYPATRAISRYCITGNW